MSTWTCPCGFAPAGPDDEWWGEMFTAAWLQRHADHHLAVFPGVDIGTRANLKWMVALAELREAEL